MTDLGKALEKKRGDLGISLNKVARDLDTTLNTYYTWVDELRPSVPQPKNWDKIADFLEVDRVEVALLAGLLSDKEVRAYCEREKVELKGSRKNAKDTSIAKEGTTGCSSQTAPDVQKDKRVRPGTRKVAASAA